MFQSKGYFRNVTCPEEGTCKRPYCQLKHRGGGEQEEGGATAELRALVRQTVRRMLSTGQAYGATSLARLDGEEIVAKVLREIQGQGGERPSYSPTPVVQLQASPTNRATYGKSLRPSFQPHNSAHPSTLIQENSQFNNIQHDSFNVSPGNEVYSSNSYSTNIDNDANSFYESHFNKNITINNTEVQQHIQNSAFSQPTYLGADKQQNYNKQGDNWPKSNEQCNEEEQSVNLMNNETSIRSPRKNNTSLQYDREKRKIHSDDDTRKKIKLDRGQPRMDMDTHLETSSEWNKGIILSQEHSYETSFPPLKKVRSQCDENTPTSTTEGWRRASEFLATGQKRNGLIRINPVPNVHAYLKNKTVREEGKNGFMKEPPCSGETSSNIQVMTPYEERPLIKRALRKAHKPSNNAFFSPPVLHEPSSRIPIAIRNSSIKKLFEELNNFLNKELASEKAQRMELDLCTRISTLKPYKNAIALAVLRIRKNKGHVEDVDVKNQILTSDSVPVFTNGWSLYQCFEQYVMSGEEYKRNGYPMKHSNLDGCAYIEKSARRSKPLKLGDSLQRVCEHCCRTYFVDERGFPTEENNCHYHWGKVRRVREYGGLTERYSCCDGDLMTDPCTTGRYHVSSTFDEDLLEGFVSTGPQGSWEVAEKAGIYGLDCEMCYTTRGVELARCTLVDLNGRTVYDKVVVPEAPILDYCTRFSGITEDMVGRASLRLRDVQADLLRVVSEKTILVGHSLENDMKVLRLFHGALVDTSLVFPHKQGRPYKNSLRHLSKDLLNIVIQENESGHDSYEDANACLQIMLWKIKEDAKKRKNRLILSLEAKNNRAGE